MVKKDTSEWHLFKDLFVLYSDNSEPEDTDAYWKHLYDQAKEMEKKYRDTDIEEIARFLFLAIIKALELKWRKKNYG